MNSRFNLKKNILVLLVLASRTFFAQVNVRDSVVSIFILNPAYSLEVPGAAMASRFGINSAIEFQLLYKTDRNWIWGISGDYLFGNVVKQSGTLDSITTPDRFLIASNGKLVDEHLSEEGFTTFVKVGKLIPKWGPNPNSGIMAIAGVGFLEDHIKIDLVDGNDQIAPQLNAEMRKGYDRLSNGIAFNQCMGYLFMSNNHVANFFAGIEVTEGLVKDRRYDYDLMSYNNKLDLDLLLGIRVGWILPLYRKVPKEYYTY
jgi:hypothetical protein